MLITNDGRPAFMFRQMFQQPFFDKPKEGEENTDDDKSKENEEEEPEESKSMTDAQKAYVAKVREEAIAAAKAELDLDKVKADAKAEAKADLEKEQKTAQRKLAQQKAKDDGDKDEILRLANEERDLAKKEAEDLKVENQKVKDETTKIRIAAKHKLPDGWHVRLLGKNEAEWEKDAAELAKAAPVKAPKVDLETGERGTGTAEQQKTVAGKKASTLTSMF